MSFGRQFTFWIAALLLLALLLWVLGDILLPFIAGMALAYLLDPVARYGERLGVSRTVSALVLVAAGILVIVVAIMAIAPVASEQLTAFVADIPSYIAKLRAIVFDPSRPWLVKLLGGGSAEGGTAASDLISQGSGIVTTFLASLVSGGQAVFSLLSLLIVTPVVAFYLLCDWDRLVESVDGYVPLRHRETVRELAREMDDAVAGFVRGQALVCLLLGIFYAVGLTLAGLKFGFLIGLLSGLFSFVPFVGAILGFIIATAVAIAQFWPEYLPIGIVIVIYVGGQALEGNVLSPKLVGARVGLHPVWLMFALLAFGYLFGFVGVLVAIPLAACVGVLVRFALRKYMESPLYTGGGGR